MTVPPLASLRPQLWPTTSHSICGAAATRTPTNKTGVLTITSTITSGVTRSPERASSKWTSWSFSRTRSRSCRGRRGIRTSWRAASRRRHTDWVLGLEIIFREQADQLVQRRGETGRRLQAAPKPEASFTSTATLQDLDQNTSESSPFSRGSPILSSLNVLSRSKRRCFTVTDIQARRAGFNSKDSFVVFPPTVLIFHPCRGHICETIECNNQRRNLVFMVAGLKTEMTLRPSLSIILIFVHPHRKRPVHYQNIV